MTIPHYSISTPENVDLHLELAGIGSRIWAAFIDTIIINLAALIVTVFLGLAVAFIDSQTRLGSMRYTIIYGFVALGILAVFVLQFAYFIVYEKLWQGQTPGKRLTGIRVVESTGQPVNWTSVIIRNLLRMVDAGFMVVGVVFIIFDKNERRIGDMLAGTLVIRERPPALLSRNLVIESEIPASFSIDSGKIEPEEYQLLLDFLRRRRLMNPESRRALAKEMADHFRAKIISGSPANDQASESAENFLEKLYVSYNSMIGSEQS